MTEQFYQLNIFVVSVSMYFPFYAYLSLRSGCIWDVKHQSEIKL